MLRVSFGAQDAPPWELSEDDFLSKIEALHMRGFVGAPFGRVSVEGVDEHARVCWRSFYASAEGLMILAREIREARAAEARRKRP